MVWSNLKAHHYRDDLTRPSDVVDGAGGTDVSRGRVFLSSAALVAMANISCVFLFCVFLFGVRKDLDR